MKFQFLLNALKNISSPYVDFTSFRLEISYKKLDDEIFWSEHFVKYYKLYSNKFLI